METKGLTQVAIHFRQHRRIEGEHHDKVVLKNNGGYTVVIRRNPEKLSDFVMTYARCGKADNFNKAIGLNIAVGRMEHTRRDLRVQYNMTTLLWKLEQFNSRTNERYSREFFEKLLSKLV